jgi:hypothetical protein
MAQLRQHAESLTDVYLLLRIALALVRAGHEVTGTTRSAESAKKLEAEESEYLVAVLFRALVLSARVLRPRPEYS